MSHSLVNIQGTKDYFTAEVDTVGSCMASLGDDSLSIVKMDIEGAEFRVLESMIREGVLPDVLLVEFDQPWPWGNIIKMVNKLKASGYDVVKIDHWNYTFVRREF